MDEPSLGLAPILVDQIFDIIQSINKEGISIILVEQNAQMALNVAKQGLVIETGCIAVQVPHIGTYSFEDVMALAQTARGTDPFGYRAEFLKSGPACKFGAAVTDWADQ